MDGRTLTRLRLAFVALGVALLLPLALLVRSASARLEEQRRLKHEVVAERIFDEMERELAALLERERARPSVAYDATNTRPETWARFVVGYFTCSASGPEITARHLLNSARAERAEAAAREAWRTWRPPGAPAQPELNPYRTSSIDDLLDGALMGNPVASKQNPAPARAQRPESSPRMEQAPKQENVLRQLNRASQKKRAGAKESSAGQDLQLNPYKTGGGDDPLSGLDDL